MLKIGVICEYNLFHNGHALQLEAIRERFGDCAVISVMSGNFSQRGEPCSLPKYVRARAAVEAGADIVTELPFPWCCSVAERFALAGVSIIDAFDCDYICFGSESGDLDRLRKAAETLDSPEFLSVLRRAVKTNPELSFPRLRAEVFELFSGEPLPILPNDILAVEYLRSLKKLEARAEPFAITRKAGFTATEARKAFNAGLPLDGIVPDAAKEIFKREAVNFDPPFDGGLLTALRRCENPENDAARRLCEYSKYVTSRAELYKSCSNATFTDAHMRRQAMYIFSAVNERSFNSLPRFSTLLAAKAGTTSILKGVGDIEIVTKPADYTSLSNEAKRQFSRSLDADGLYSLLRNEPSSENLKRTPYIK